LSKDYYQILGVNSNASEDEIKKAYRKLAIKHHQDRNPDDAEAKKRFQEIETAHEVLKDPQKRAAYDRVGHEAFQGSGGFHAGPDFSDFAQGDFSSIFEDFVSQFGGGSARQSRARDTGVRGDDIYYQMDLTLEEAFQGKSDTIRFKTMTSCQPCKGTGSKSAQKPDVCRQCRGRGQVNVQRGIFMMATECQECRGVGVIISDPCGKCRGLGRVRGDKDLKITIPKGIEDESQVRIAQKGGAGVRGGGFGDLYVQIRIRTHDLFQRIGADLYCEQPISMSLAALGGRISVPTIDGEEAEVSIPAGTQYGDKIALRARGMSQLNRSQRGVFYVKASVYTPLNLSDEQKDLMKALQESEKNYTPRVQSRLQKIKQWFKKPKPRFRSS
jgi:molecular chaperone DnaJ